jgi:1,4-dihydroxy-2-naphthoate octaprenyltransferase
VTIRSRLFAGVFRLSDPKISLASVAAMFLGACAAGREGPLEAGWLALTVLGVFAIEVAKNASGEVFDFASGADLGVAAEDRTPFSGGKRVLVDGLLTKRQTVALAAAGYALGAAVGLWIVFFREPRVLWFGLVGMGAAFFYHAPPLKLAYRGLGEAAVGVCYGPLICAGTYLVQRGTVTLDVLWLSLPLGLSIAAFLWINEFPDVTADREAGKRTLVVRLGRRRASGVYVAILGLAYVILAALPLAGLPQGVWLGAAGIVPAASAARRLLASPETTVRLIPAQARTLVAFLLLAFGSGLGLLLAGKWIV